MALRNILLRSQKVSSSTTKSARNTAPHDSFRVASVTDHCEDDPTNPTHLAWGMQTKTSEQLTSDVDPRFAGQVALSTLLGAHFRHPQNELIAEQVVQKYIDFVAVHHAGGSHISEPDAILLAQMVAKDPNMAHALLSTSVLVDPVAMLQEMEDVLGADAANNVHLGPVSIAGISALYAPIPPESGVPGTM